MTLSSAFWRLGPGPPHLLAAPFPCRLRRPWRTGGWGCSQESNHEKLGPRLDDAKHPQVPLHFPCRDGRIKLYGADGVETLLVSPSMAAIKHLQVLETPQDKSQPITGPFEIIQRCPDPCCSSPAVTHDSLGPVLSSCFLKSEEDWETWKVQPQASNYSIQLRIGQAPVPKMTPCLVWRCQFVEGKGYIVAVNNINKIEVRA